MPEQHADNCAWELTPPTDCEFRGTHYYCPHPEHACSCTPLSGKVELR